MRYTTRPISDWTEFNTGEERKPNPFRASYSDTLDLLSSELAQLGAGACVIEIDCREVDLRLDGMLKSKAKVGHPGVRIAFESIHGPLTYATDRYAGRWYSDPPDWQINLRAIALGLEALRAVDRYGVTRRGEQYTGFKALPAGRAMPASHMTRQEAAEVLERIAVGGEGASRTREVERILGNPFALKEVLREAWKVAHPDRRRGDRTLWDQVEQAAQVLGVTR